MSFKLASSPHTRKNNKTAFVMLTVMSACIPGILTQAYFFGFGVFIQLAICMSVALFTEYACLKWRNKPIKRSLTDNSALLTGLLLAVSIPPLAPWWIGAIGTLFAIALVKQAYGGLGQNIFNPAMAAYVLLLVSFPLSMTSWLPASSLMVIDLNFYDTLSTILTGYTSQGYSLEQLRSGIDGLTMATPLDAIKTNLLAGYTYNETLSLPIFDNGIGKGWFYVSLAYLVGGLYLLKKRIIKWQIPVSFIGTLGFLTLVTQAVNADGTGSMLLHLTSGATCFAAFFILTDPVSAATTNKGRLIYGALIGFLVFIIRQFGGYPDAVAFAVLLANMTVPLIDYYTQPKVFGHGDK
ncbi:electron transport complex subunit RsxD [Algibacillus agarilyticus]|uniref:electron transport complex subunit RsxD n=1 Tax=Algibacillus agarilyticus TaxID=2234133 RepID=UPI000DCF9C42|nr:electron transport complex subunit RsxD [Algibacillus agarilyticus]